MEQLSPSWGNAIEELEVDVLLLGNSVELELSRTPPTVELLLSQALIVVL